VKKGDARNWKWQGFVRKKQERSPLKKYLFRDPTGKYPQVCTGITPWKVITASYFEIGFL
jgi:hypothetical protein